MNEIDPIYKEFARKLGLENSKYLPQILEKLANLEQAKIIRELPNSSEEIAKKLNLDVKKVDKHIQELIEKGLVFPTRKGPQMARSIVQLHDAALANPKFDKELGVEFFDLFAKLMDEEALADGAEQLAGGDRPMWRIIPLWNSIKEIPGILPSEDVREIIKSQEIIALLHCPCKRERTKRDCGVPTEVCINFRRTAQYNINRGAAKRITAEEALQVIELTNNHPLIHLSLNQAEVDQLLCSCHKCCCGPMTTMLLQKKYKLTDGIAKSRFEAVVHKENCTGCEICISRCQFEAAKMKYYSEFGEERAYIDIERCMGCGSCVVSCPEETIKMKLVRPPDHIPQAAERLY